MKVKYIPNILCVLRIGFALCLPFIGPGRPAFFVVYLAAGLTDILDGPIARRTGSQSVFGARLDSAADLVLFGVILLVFWPFFTDTPLFIVWGCLIALVRLASGLVNRLRFSCFTMLHTWGNKAAGLAVFALPLFYLFFPFRWATAIVFSIASLSAAEELGIYCTTNTLRPNIKSWFNR